jgi:phosphoribosylanthranilate isomerase
MVPRVKICGITNLEDAEAAVAAGADALGFIFVPATPRYVTLEQATGLIRSLPPLVAKVGVFMDADEGTVRKTVELCGLDTLQLHGRETPEFCQRFAPLKVIKAFRIRDESTVLQLPAYATAAWLLDSYVPGKAGGSSTAFDWELAVSAKRFGRPFLLAGGLTPENVAAAVRQVQPYGVDVSSGVEQHPGRKDHAKVADFIRQAKLA